MVVMISLSSLPVKAKIGFPRAGKWANRFDSDSTKYDSGFSDATGREITAAAAPSDGLDASAEVNVGPYGAIIFSQQ